MRKTTAQRADVGGLWGGACRGC